MMFLFIIPRTPLKLQNQINEELWKITQKSLLAQTSDNWKAIVLSGNKEKKEKHFIHLNIDDYPKNKKIQIAVDYILANKLKPEFIIRLDEDDLINPNILKNIENQPKKYDIYYDAWHVYIDPVFQKISFRKNYWIPNTAIHGFNHSIKKCGPANMPLIIQDHSEYWHVYYKNKKVQVSSRKNPIYYRVFSPNSTTSRRKLVEKNSKWKLYMEYIDGFGPWISLSKNFYYFRCLLELRDKYFEPIPQRPRSYWLYNKIKHLKNYFLK